MSSVQITLQSSLENAFHTMSSVMQPNPPVAANPFWLVQHLFVELSDVGLLCIVHLTTFEEMQAIMQRVWHKAMSRLASGAAHDPIILYYDSSVPADPASELPLLLSSAVTIRQQSNKTKQHLPKAPSNNIPRSPEGLMGNSSADT